jgi:hypothetical protein
MGRTAAGIVESICDEASQATDLHDFGDDWFLEPLTAWAEDLLHPNLNDFGRRFLRSQAVRDVARRLRVLATLRDNPEIAEVPIPPILYITGMERSGTTLLHNLLSLHPLARPFRRWELMEPVPPPETATYDADPRSARMQASMDPLRGSMLEQMHWVNADDPEECVWGYIDAVSMLGQSASICMPAWRAFLAGADFTTVFEHYRQLVQLLLWKHPIPPGGFLVLKAPQIGRSIASMASVFPEAFFVVTDRDPFRCIVSMAVLGEAIVEPFCVVNPITDDGARNRLTLQMAGPKLDAIAAFTDASPRRVLHIEYPALVREPASSASVVLDAAGAPPVEMAPAVEAFLAGQRSGRRAAPPRALDSMAYTHDDVWADPAVASYCERFGIAPEHTRLTGGG